MRRLGLLLPLVAALGAGASCKTGATFPEARGPAFFHVAVAVTGNGMSFATISSVPPGIDCGGGATACDADFATNSSVVLHATGASVVDWTGDCGGTIAGPCSVVMSADRSMTARVATSGSIVWVRAFGSTSNDSGRKVVIGGSGDPIVAGVMAGSFGLSIEAACSPPPLGGGDVFAARLSARDGSCVWGSAIGGTAFEDLEHTAVLASGAIVMHATTTSPTFFVGTSSIMRAAGDTENRVLVAFNEDDGSVEWAYGGVLATPDSGAAVCASGDTVFTVEGTDGVTGRGVQYGRFLGGTPWSFTIGRSAVFDIRSEFAACDAIGLVVGGNYFGPPGESLIFPDATSDITVGGLQGGNDGWLVHMDTEGVPLWVQVFSSPGSELLTEVATLSGNRTLAGLAFQQDFPVGNGFNANHKGLSGLDADVVVLTIASDGVTTAAWSFGGNGEQRPGAIVSAGTNGSFILAGTYTTPFELAAPVTQGRDLYVARVSNANGLPLWSRTLSGTGEDFARSLAYQDGVVYLSGRWVSSAPVKLQNFMGQDIILTPRGGQDIVVMRLVP